MANKELQTSEFKPSGVLDMDSGLRSVSTSKGDYINAIDIQHLPNGTNQEEFIINALGNKFVFSLPTIVEQDKTYQITISIPAAGSVTYSIGLLNINGSPNAVNTFASQVVNSTDTLSTVVASFISSIQTLLSVYSPTVVTGSAPGTIDITLSPTSISGWDYLIIDNPTSGTTSSNPVVIAEAIPQNLSGDCYPVGGYDYLGDLFILSSCQNKTPQILTVVSINVVSGSVVVTLSGDQTGNISDNDEITLSGISGLSNDYNGNWIALSVTLSGGNTTLELFAAETFIGTLSGSPVLITNNTGFLDISVFQYSVQNNTWTGTQLLDTKALNNRVYNPLTMFEIDESNQILNLYFSDNNDTPRCWKYTGPYVTNGSIQPLVPTGYYFYESINLDAVLFEENATCTIALNSVSNAGGNVASGIWKYAGCFLDASKNASYPSLLSGPVIVYSADTSDPVTVMGDTAGVATTKQVSLQINDIPADAYPYFQLIGVNNIGGVETAYIIKTVTIPEGTTTLQITHTGFETYIDYHAGLLDQQGEVYNTVKTGAIVKNTLVLGNITQPAIKDLTEWAQTFNHTIGKNTTALAPVGDDVSGFKVGEYMDPQAVFSYVGYTDNETLRFGIELELNNGSRTPAFWVDDIRFDNYKQISLTLNTVTGFNVGDTVTQGSLSSTILSISGNIITLTTETVFSTGTITDSTTSATATVTLVTQTPFNRAGIKGNRRLGSFSSYDLSDVNSGNATNNAYVTYVTFSGIDFTYKINGQPIYEFAKRLHIVRIDNIKNDFQEVLGCGLSVRHVTGSISTAANKIFGIMPGAPVTTNVFDNPLLLTWDAMNVFQYTNGSATPMSTLFPKAGVKIYNPYSYGAWTGGTLGSLTFTSVLSSCSFYCPDAIFGQTFIEGESGDALINFGQPDFRSGGTFADASPYDTFGGGTQAAGTICNALFWSQFIKLSGSTGQSTEPTGPNLLSLVASSVVNVGSFGGNESFFTGHTYSPNTLLSSVAGVFSGFSDYQWNLSSHLIMNCSTNILQSNSNMWNGFTDGSPHAGAYDLGLYYMQYYRDKGSKTAYITGTSKFGDITQGVYTTTNCYINITDTNSASLDVYGGDTFTQKTFYKLRYPQIGPTDSTGYATGSGVCIAFFCQNHFNWNMRNHIIPADTMAYPNYPLGSWLNNPTLNPDNTNYDSGYTPQNIENDVVAFDPAAAVATYMYEREAYSGVKAQDSLTNSYRQFLPLDITDLSPNYGPITKLIEIQGELFSLQPKAFMRQFYNETGTLNVSDAASESEVILGSGASFTKPPQLLSTNGCSNIFSVLKGKGISGEDVVAWVDVINKTIMLFSKAGVKDIGLEGRLRSYLVNAMTWITGDNPTLRNGITGVFNEIRKEFIWTFSGYYPAAAWNSLANYNKGAIVSEGTVFEGIPQLYKSLQTPNTGHNPTSSPTYWQAIPINNTAYYSFFTLVYSLIKQGFTTFMTPKPYMYFEWQNTYLTPYPDFSFNDIFQADLGLPTTWYTVRTSQTNNAFITWVTNDGPSISKTFLADWCNSLVAPYSMNFNTIKNASYLVAADWDSAFDYWSSPIKNDSIPTGLNTDDTSSLIGDYLVQTLFFQTGVVQQFYEMYTKYIINFRIPLK